MKTIITILLLSIANQLFADSPEIDFGKVSISEMKMTIYNNDSTISAVVLSDIGKTYIYEDILVKRHLRIKILKKDGYKYGTFEIPFSIDAAFTVDAISFNLENSIITQTKFDDDNLVIREIKERNINIAMFSLPKVTVGTVIDLEYSINSFSYFDAREWVFQRDIPTLRSEFYFLRNRRVAFNRAILGSIKIDIAPVRKDIDENECHHYEVDSVPAFVEEDYMLSKDNFISKVIYELNSRLIRNRVEKFSTSWDDVYMSLINSDYFYDQIDDGDFLSEKLETLIPKNSSDYEKMEIIFNHIKEVTAFNGKYRLFCSQDIDDTYEKQSGNVADINLLLIAVLKEAGLKVSPIVTNTRNYSVTFDNNPSIKNFNYVMAYVTIGNKNYFLDASDDYLKINMIPFCCLNSYKFFLIEDSDPSWITYRNKNMHKIISSTEISIDNLGNIKGSLTKKLNGYAALSYRKKVDSFDDIDDYVSDIENNNSNIEIEDYKITNLDDVEKSIKSKMIFSIEQNNQRALDKIYFNPILFNTFINNPFKLKDRSYPIDYGYKSRYNYYITITIPDGYTVEDTPKDIRISLPNKYGFFAYSCKISKNKIIINSIFRINKREIPAGYYQYIKKFYNIIISKYSEVIELKKI